MSVCPDLEDDQLHVRESMEKFKSDHHELEVVQYTKPGKLVRLFLFTVVYCVSPLCCLGYCFKWHCVVLLNAYKLNSGHCLCLMKLMKHFSGYTTIPVLCRSFASQQASDCAYVWTWRSQPSLLCTAGQHASATGQHVDSRKFGSGCTFTGKS